MMKILNFFEIEEGRKIAYRIYFSDKNDSNYEDCYLDDFGEQIIRDCKNRQKKIIFCVHALTRNGTDFEILAEKILESNDEYVFICPDIVGRGESDYLENKENYNYEFYKNDLLCLIDFLEIENCYWIGVSMGGILGMMVNKERPDLIEKMILNDISPESPQKARSQIFEYFSKSYKEYDSYEEISQNLKDSFVLFGISFKEDWDFFISNSVKQNENGKFIFNYDFEILRTLEERFSIYDSEFNQEYDSTWILAELIDCPLMLIWGKLSTMLTPEIISKFQEKKPGMLLVKVPNVGHAPTLMNNNLIKAIKFWLGSSEVISGEVLVSF